MKPTKEKTSKFTVKKDKIMVNWMRRFGLTFCLLALAAFAASCGVDQSPVASGPDEGMPAAKRIKSNGVYASVETTVEVVPTVDDRTVTGIFGPEGGNLTVVDKNGKGKKDDIEVSLMMAAGVLTEDLPITMTVNGEDLSTLVVVFEPAGKVFSRDLDLRIDLGNNLAQNSDVNKITPYHIYADGSVEDVNIYHIDRSSNALNIYIKVPGFSRYSLRR